MKKESPVLPDDLAQCHAVILEMADRIHALETMSEKQKHQLVQLLRYRYGQRSDRIQAEQMVLWALDELESQAEESQEEEPKGQGRRKRKGHGRRPLPKDLPRKRVVHDATAEEKHCGRCENDKQVIREEITEKLEYIPASMFILENVRLIYACKTCDEPGMVQAAKPMEPVEKGIPGPGLLAHVITSKYADHLPLYRLEGIFGRHGVDIRRSTMCGWMAHSADLLLPLHERMCTKVLQSKFINTDDTPVGVQDRNLTKTRKGRLWVYIGDRGHPYTVFDYTPNRSRDGPVKFLKGYGGYLQADAYPGYDILFVGGHIVEVACWHHARRKFTDAEHTHPASAVIAGAWIRRLSRIEKQAKRLGLGPEARKALRQEEAKPILEGFKEWMEKTLAEVLPKSVMGQAIGYALGNWEALNRYLDDGDLEWDNGRAERALKIPAIGRKNWLFFGSDRGGRTAAILTSFTATCKDLKIDPFVYLRDVLERISEHPMSRLEELLPDRWLAEQTSAIPPVAA
jgi:transposase